MGAYGARRLLLRRYASPSPPRCRTDRRHGSPGRARAQRRPHGGHLAASARGAVRSGGRRESSASIHLGDDEVEMKATDKRFEGMRSGVKALEHRTSNN